MSIHWSWKNSPELRTSVNFLLFSKSTTASSLLHMWGFGMPSMLLWALGKPGWKYGTSTYGTCIPEFQPLHKKPRSVEKDRSFCSRGNWSPIYWNPGFINSQWGDPGDSHLIPLDQNLLLHKMGGWGTSILWSVNCVSSIACVLSVSTTLLNPPRNE